MLFVMSLHICSSSLASSFVKRFRNTGFQNLKGLHVKHVLMWNLSKNQTVFSSFVTVTFIVIYCTATFISFSVFLLLFFVLFDFCLSLFAHRPRMFFKT